MADQQIEYLIYRPTADTNHTFEVLADLMKQHPNLVRIGHDPTGNELYNHLQQVRVNIKPYTALYNTMLYPHNYELKFGTRRYFDDLSEFLKQVKEHWTRNYEYLVYTPVEGSSDTLEVLNALVYKYPKVVRSLGILDECGAIRVSVDSKQIHNVCTFVAGYDLSMGTRKHFTDPAEFLDAVQNYWGE